MTTYTFTTSTTSTHTFTSDNDIDAAQIAEQLRQVFNVPKTQCHLTRLINKYKPSQPNQFRTTDPSGPFTNIPILINGRWYTPNGHPIHDIAGYKTRVRQSAMFKQTQHK